MKVLEVGGGTAGATLPLFKGTSQYGKLPLRLYDFTDISAGFFDNARHVLRRWERQLSFKTFDCSKDPVAQGFEVGTYDLIIAYNSIHASRSIDESITNVRKLLKTGGRLMLIEITRLEPFVNAIFGLLPGWYMDRSDGRKDAPILSVEEWNSRLIHGGFNGCEFVRHDQDGPSKTTSLIVSRAISVAKEILKSFPTYIVHDNSQSVRSLLGQKIQKLSFQTARIHLSTQCIDNEALYVIIDDHLYGSILSSSSKLVDRVSKVVSGAKNVLWIITPRYPSAISNHASGLAIGFARGVRASNEAINFVTFDIQGDSIDFDDLDQTIHNLSNACFLSSNFSMDMDYIYRDGKVHIPRLKPNRNCQSTTLSKMTTGLVPSHQCNQIIQPLQKKYVISNPPQYIATNLPGAPSRHSDIEVKVDAWSVSTEDLLASFGQGPSKSIIGGFFGTIVSVGHQDSWKTGDQIYGWSKAIYANSVRVSADSVCHYPKSISIEEAVCIPITFLTAFYALVDIGRIRKGQGVIVHDAVSPVGQAAIQVSRYIGADVIAVITVEEHRQYLIDKYKLSEDRVILPHDSRHFRIAVSRRLTNNGGAQLILNPSPGGGQLIVDSITCLARFGTFIQIGSIDTSSKLSISTEIFEKNVSVISPHLAAISELQPEKMTELMRHVNLMFKTGNMLPITPARTMKIGEIENAVKLIQQENLTGQIVLETSRTARVDLVSTPSLLKYTEDATYLVVGNSTILSIDVYKFLLLYGAMNILILFTGTWEEKTKIEKQLAQEETKIIIISSANEISINLNDIPPIRGIIYTEFVSIFHPTTSVDIAGYIERYVEHINSIMSCIKPEILDFLVIISSSLLFPRARTRSIDCAISASRQALLASGLKEKTRLIHIDIANLVPMAKSYQSEQEEISLGRSNYSRQETFAILESELRSTEQYQGYSHVVVGLRESIFRGKIKLPLDSSLLRNLPEIWKQDELTITTVPHQTTLESINDSIVYAKTEEQARRIVELAVRKKIASMMAVQYELIDTKTSIEDFGLDSLIIFTFRNWIFQNFRADLNVGIISSASSIDDLVSGILSLTTINNFANQNESKSEHHDSHFKPATSFSIPCSDYRTDLLPKQPLPDLEDTLRYYLDAARTFCSEEELTTTKRLVEYFKSIGGQGHSLQARLLERQNDPKLDNWLSDIYLTRRFLQQRAPLLATQSYFGTHPNGPISHTQAERAVIVTLAALKFKISYESGSLSKQGLYGQAIDTHAYRYLFIVCREPHVSEDIIREYPRENHIVVFNNGHGYKINLTMNNEDISFDDLETLFKKILQEPIEPKSWAGILTADSRDDWAKARDSLIQLDKRNKLSVETIQAAAFIVCFDNATPETPLQRFSQFLYGDGSNRWYDKSLQFVVCKNGISASLCEHSVLDGITIGFLHEFINQAIFEYESSSHTNRVTTPNSSLLEPLNLSLDPFLEDRIKKVRQNFTETTSKYSFAHLQLKSLSQEFLSEKGLPTQSGIQLAIQLAYLRFFNYSPPALETVSLAQFRQGRVEVHHIITPLMAQFILTNKNAINPHSRRLLYDAAREHAKSLTRASKGRGFSRHLLALEWMLREGEESPAFFQDPVYKRMKPAKAVTSFFATGWQEGGFVYPFPGSILVYFEVKDDSVSFSIFGNEADAEGFRNHLELSGADMRRLLDGPEPDDS